VASDSSAARLVLCPSTSPIPVSPSTGRNNSIIIDDCLVTVYDAGQFTGEVNTLSGRPTLCRWRVTKSGEVIELDRQHLLTLVQTDAELGEIMMKTFVLRRLELLAAGIGDVVLIGSIYLADTLRIKEFLVWTDILIPTLIWNVTMT
jgi:hypothetical protein